MKNIYGGGCHANTNGAKFEQETSMEEALRELDYEIENNIVIKDNKNIGELIGKEKLYKFLEKHGGKNNLSKKIKPDEAFYNYKDDKIYIVEKKFQNRAGSIDEKIETAHFKKKQYTKLFSTINKEVEYMYLFNYWYKADRYKDSLEYILDVGCYYFYDELPLSAIGL